jgi:hypothetical protein
MMARKIFQIWVGFFCGGLAFTFTYFAGSFIYSLIRGAAGDSPASLFQYLPGYAMFTSVALPLALAVFVWRTKKYIAVGLLLFSLSSLVFCLTWGSPNPPTRKQGTHHEAKQKQK